jgi:deoxyribonuclease-4
MRIGAHMSAAGGVSRAVERAVLHECEALQVFAKNNARWIGKPIEPDDARRFREAVEAADLEPVVSHASYLINLAAVPGGPGNVREKSIDALVDELERARLLDLMGVVVHPGVAAPDASDDEAIALVGEAIRAAFARAPGDRPLLLIEHTAGQGRSIGHRFEHLAAIFERLDGSPRVGVCLDTCHLLAAGYDIASEPGYAETIASFDRLVGLDRLKVIHANDSKRRLGSRLDRHQHIGDGFVGLDGFRRLLHDPRLAHLAMVIETHKTPGICDHPRVAKHDPLDWRNLETLRALQRLD